MQKPMTPRLPDGYQARPVTLADLEPAVALFNTVSKAVSGVESYSVARARTEWQAPLMNLATNTQAVFTPDRQIIAYMDYWTFEPHVRLLGWPAIHPDHWGQGIEDFLATWLVERARNDIDRAPGGARIVLHVYAESNDTHTARLLTRHGFAPIRSSYTMKIDFRAAPPAPALPEGITIRAIAGADEKRAVLLAAFEAFKDHWGHVDEPFENYYQRRMMFLQDDPLHDPSLWWIALDGATIAGMALCNPGTEEDPAMGWVQTLGVQRPWRNRGVGLALLQYAFDAFYRRGNHSAGLSVDAASLTGATRLYEKAGMRVLRQSDLYELELRPGADWMTQTVS